MGHIIYLVFFLFLRKEYGVTAIVSAIQVKLIKLVFKEILIPIPMYYFSRNSLIALRTHFFLFLLSID